MYLFTLSGTAVLLGLGGVCLLLTLGVYLLRRRLHHARPSPSDSRTKLAAADLFRYSLAIHRVSLCAALFASLLTINWTQWQSKQVLYTGVIEVEEVIEQLPPRTYDPPKPPPPLPPPTIEAVPDIEAPTVELIDQSISEDEPVFKEVPVFTKPAATPKPLPPPPAPPEEEIPDIFIFAERMPVFGEDCKVLDGEERKSCSDRALLSFVQSGVKYPPLAQQNNIQGTVVVKFIVEKDGTVSSIEPVRELGGGCTAAAISAIQRINTEGQRFSPGIQAGKPVRVAFNLPIKFRLN